MPTYVAGNILGPEEISGDQDTDLRDLQSKGKGRQGTGQLQ